MKEFIANNRIFLTLQIAFVIVGGILILLYEQGSEILYINNLHSNVFNHFFSFVSRIAEAPLLVLILLTAIAISYGKGFLLLVTYLLNGAITQILKILVFTEQVRPAIFFEGKAKLNFVEGVELLRDHSLPSGHTSSAFAVFFMISILTQNKTWSYLLFILALLVGISRVYLLMHFFRDIYWGSICGTLVAMFLYLTLAQSNFYQGLSWKDKSLVK